MEAEALDSIRAFSTALDDVFLWHSIGSWTRILENIQVLCDRLLHSFGASGATNHWDGDLSGTSSKKRKGVTWSLACQMVLWLHWLQQWVVAAACCWPPNEDASAFLSICLLPTKCGSSCNFAQSNQLGQVAHWTLRLKTATEEMKKAFKDRGLRCFTNPRALALAPKLAGKHACIKFWVRGSCTDACDHKQSHRDQPLSEFVDKLQEWVKKVVAGDHL